MGLLYLRARWYMPETGTFLSVDLVEGEPLYMYVRGNPVNRIDPSGYVPKKGEVGTKYMYSCNCGWIDWSHARVRGDKLIRDIYNAKQREADYVLLPAIGGRNGAPFSIPVFTPISPFSDPQVAYQEYHINGGVRGEIMVFTGRSDWHSTLEVALGVYISGNNLFEDYQSEQGFGVIDRLTKSSFSEEDLMSNLIGFYRAVSFVLGTGAGDSSAVRNNNKDQSMQYFMRLCGVVGMDEPNFIDIQNNIYDEYNEDFRQVYIWGQPRLDGWDGSVESGDCPTKACRQPRRMPSLFTQIEPKSPLTDWWWISAYKYMGVNETPLWVSEYEKSNINGLPLNWQP